MAGMILPLAAAPGYANESADPATPRISGEVAATKPRLTAEAARLGRTPGEALRAYWTSARMKKAGTGTRASAVSVAVDPPSVSRAVPVFGPYSTGKPNRFIGKVFFTLPDGRDSACSGSVVSAPNRSLVSTAAHCVDPDGGHGDLVRNFVFVPAAYNGTAPLGVWTPRVLTVMNEWQDNPHHAGWDLGAAIVTRDPAGRGIEDVLGAFVVAHNRGNIFMSAVGYPVDGRFGFAIQQWYCAGRTTILDSTQPGTGRERSMMCDFVPGASGGPWYWGVRPIPGFPVIWYLGGQTAKTGQGFSYSPHFGDRALAFYDLVGRI
ncbi:hypothetical protein ABT039_41145 [Streptomyces lasiicapitis]|uniref:trypsin-like serine peptidase n=1 Tax=Streptomyces lasiicapitis TaxID=1923961 RepID=UPI00333236D0